MEKGFSNTLENKPRSSQRIEHLPTYSKGGEQQLDILTAPHTSNTHSRSFRIRSTSLSGHVALGISSNSKYVSDYVSVVDLTESGSKVKPRNLSLATVRSSTSTASVQPALVQVEESSAVNQTSDTARDMEEDNSITKFPNEARSLVFGQNDHTTEIFSQSSQLLLRSLQETALSDRAMETNAAPCPQPNHVKTVSLHSETENKNPVMKLDVARRIRTSDESAALFEKPTTNETVHNGGSVLSYIAPSAHKEKEISSLPEREVSVPFLQNKNYQDKSIESLTSSPTPPLSPHTIGLPSVSACLPEAPATPTNHQLPYSEPSQEAPSSPLLSNTTSCFHSSSSTQRSTNFHFEKPLHLSHLQSQYSEGNISQAQVPSKFSAGKNYFDFTRLETKPSHVYVRHSRGLSGAHQRNHIQPNSCELEQSLTSDVSNIISLNLSRRTRCAVANQPNAVHVSNDYRKNSSFQANLATNNASQINPMQKQKPLLELSQVQQQTQKPYILIMHPCNLPNSYHYEHAQPLGLPMCHDVIPVVGQPSFRADLQSHGFLPLHQPQHILPQLLPGSAFQQQCSTPTLAATFTTIGSSTSSTVHASNVPSKPSGCAMRFQTDSCDGDTLIPNYHDSDNHLASSSLLPCRSTEIKAAKGQAVLQTSVNIGTQNKNHSLRSSNSELVAMRNHHNTITSWTSNIRPAVSSVFDMSSRTDQEDFCLAGISSSCLEEMCVLQSSARTFDLSEDLSNHHSMAGPGQDCTTFTDKNGQDVPIPTVTHDRRDSLSFSIHSVPKENNSVSAVFAKRTTH
ncbi:hypothetical protein ElyMa_002912900 [Elysia marginata]|uniref:Uncharacterized protein n=1 Tax=Elysia marginata TaxID=1093978 RepID=A0AAV4I4J7_9GAST|nr:hypothetical protein ElyMa_002912900 [Elysia marginata]